MIRTSVNQAYQQNRVMLIVMAVSVFVGALVPETYERGAEYRWFRNLAGLTPFRDVAVHNQKIIPQGLATNGEMVKRRCTYDGMVGYVYLPSGLRVAVEVDASLEESARGSLPLNRPSSTKAETWGVWVVKWDGQTPDRWEIYVYHDECPSGPVKQTNLFAKGEWANLTQEE